jgi:adenylosuccinate lyase
MAAVQAGGDRQDLHERIKRQSQAAAQGVKREGRENDLLERLRGDAAFANVPWEQALDPTGFIGRAPEQVDEFLAEHVEPLLADYGDQTPTTAEISV